MTNIQKISYAMGYQMSGQMPPEVDDVTFADGMRDGKAKTPPRVSEEEIGKAFMAYQQEQQAKSKQPQDQQQGQPQVEGQPPQAAVTGDSGVQFLADNAKKPGIVTTASGLQYQVIKAGTGAKPTASSEVKVDYEGKLINGTVFDSSIKHGQPLTFGVSQVIPGWTEGLQLMSEGAEYRFFIPSELAYGAAGAGDAIPPNSALIFDVTLIKVNP